MRFVLIYNVLQNKVLGQVLAHLHRGFATIGVMGDVSPAKFRIGKEENHHVSQNHQTQRMDILQNAGCIPALMQSLDLLIKEINPFAHAYRMLHEVELD
jgi:hypothetical protein